MAQYTKKFLKSLKLPNGYKWGYTETYDGLNCYVFQAGSHQNGFTVVIAYDEDIKDNAKALVRMIELGVTRTDNPEHEKIEKIEKFKKTVTVE